MITLEIQTDNDLNYEPVEILKLVKCLWDSSYKSIEFASSDPSLIKKTTQDSWMNYQAVNYQLDLNGKLVKGSGFLYLFRCDAEVNRMPEYFFRIDGN